MSTELFDSTDYQIPFPKADGHEVTKLVLRLGGSLELNRNDPEHTALVESLTLGKHIDLSVTASVDGKTQQVRFDADDNQIVTHAVSLRLHTIDPA